MADREVVGKGTGVAQAAGAEEGKGEDPVVGVATHPRHSEVVDDYNQTLEPAPGKMGVAPMPDRVGVVSMDAPLL